jgi:hypothetical protein
MLELTERQPHLSRKSPVARQYHFSATELHKHTLLQQRDQLQRLIGCTMVGGDFERQFNSANQVVMADNSQNQLIGVALLRTTESWDWRNAAPTREPVVSVQAFGVDQSLADRGKIQKIVIDELAAEIVITAQEVSTAMYKIIGTPQSPQFQPMVTLDPVERGMEPTVRAEPVNASLDAVEQCLSNIRNATPKLGTGFGDTLGLLHTALSDLERDHAGNHAFAYEVTQWVELRKALDAVVRFGGDTEEYQRVHRIAIASLLLLTAIRKGVETSFAQLHPGHHDEQLAMKDLHVGQADGTVSLSLEGQYGSIGSARFDPRSLDDKEPVVSFPSHYGDGTLTELSAALAQAVPGNAWWRQQMKQS